MQFVVHIATTFQSFKALPRDIQELIFTRVQQENRIKNPSHPILHTTLEDYLTRQVQEFSTICHSLKHKMAVCPEFGHVIGIATKGITENGNPLTVKAAIARTVKGENNLLECFWRSLDKIIKRHGTPTFITWNGLDFTFPFIIERSAALGLTPSLVLPRARFQPWRHLDLMAELGNYDHHRYLSLKDRVILWESTLKELGRDNSFDQVETVVEQWRKGDPEPLKRHLTLMVHVIGEIHRKAALFLVDGNNNQRKAYR